MKATQREARRVRWRFIAALLCGSLVTLGPAAAQPPYVFAGIVQWIGGSTMQVIADNGSSIRVDLELVPQSEYNTLNPGDRIRVVGHVSPDRSRVIAQRIDRGDAPNVYDPYSPYPQAP